VDPLREALVELARELRSHDIPLIVGGGYGLVLRAEHVRGRGLRTRHERIPAARSTDDLDLFLSAEVITDAGKTRRIREALKKLGYEPVPTARYYQFFRPVEVSGRERKLKIDLLAPIPRENVEKETMDERRIRPRAYGELHAHTTPEAITVDQHLLPVELEYGAERVSVHIPHPFSYLVLKLFAFRDRREEALKGAYHAFDLFTIIAMMTEEEWAEAEDLRREYHDIEPLPEARAIVAEMFSSPDAIGPLRMEEHASSVNFPLPPELMDAFLVDLRELVIGPPLASSPARLPHGT
jgi:predicted nucleotidyltransferase